MYTAWWLTLCSDEAYVKGLLDSYIVYVIPVINPDGYDRGVQPGQVGRQRHQQLQMGEHHAGGKWVFYTRDEIRDTFGLDPDAITDADGVGLAADGGLWFYTSPTDQMVNRTPEEQDVMVRGCRDAILTMMESEPSGNGDQNPGFYK